MAEKEESRKAIANGQIKEIKNSSLSLFGESIRDAKDHVVHDVLKPMIRSYIGQILSECANKAIEVIFGTNGRPYRDDYRDRGGEYVSYSSYYKYGDRYDNRDNYVNYSPKYAYWDIGFISKAEADDVLNDLRYIIQDEGSVDLATFYEISGNRAMIGPQDFEWGWKDLSGVDVRQRRDGKWCYANLRKVVPVPKRRR